MCVVEESEVYPLVREIRKKWLPTSEVIVRQALSELGLTRANVLNQNGKTPEEVIKNFNSYLRAVFDKALEVLEVYEAQVYPKALRALCELRATKINEIEKQNAGATFNVKVGDAFEMMYTDLWHLFLSRSNSRKQRGGKDFEEQLGQLLRLADVPFDKQIRKYHSDFMLPSANAFNNDRTRCILLSAKRTLRERWQTVVNEIYETRCPSAFLCTADEEIVDSVISRLKDYNIHIVVWDAVKAAKFSENPLVVGYSQLADKEIQTLRQYWAK